METSGTPGYLGIRNLDFVDGPKTECALEEAGLESGLGNVREREGGEAELRLKVCVRWGRDCEIVRGRRFVGVGPLEPNATF